MTLYKNVLDQLSTFSKMHRTQSADQKLIFGCAGKADWTEGMEYFKYKYLMAVDGNTFVDRLPRLMSSGSVPFRAGLQGEWFEEWLKPKEHYLHIDLAYENLEETLTWALEHDEEAKAIGKRAQEFALTRLRKEDMACYKYRLLLEFAAILD